MDLDQNPYKPPRATNQTDGIRVPISRKFYIFVFACIIAGAIFFAIAYAKIGDESWTTTAFFAAVSILIAISLWGTSCYIFRADRYSLKIDAIGIHERSPLYSQRILWPEIVSVSLMSIDSAKPCITYRLRHRTALRFTTFGRFDAMHYNQYSLDQDAILDIILTQQAIHRVDPHG